MYALIHPDVLEAPQHGDGGAVAAEMAVETGEKSKKKKKKKDKKVCQPRPASRIFFFIYSYMQLIFGSFSIVYTLYVVSGYGADAVIKRLRYLYIYIYILRQPKGQRSIHPINASR